MGSDKPTSIGNSGTQIGYLQGGRIDFTLPDGDIEAGKNDVRYLWGSHTGCMVPVFAYGPGAERFTGIQQNTDIPRKIRELMKW